MQDKKTLLRASSDLLILVGLAALGGAIFTSLGLFIASFFSGIPAMDIPSLMLNFRETEGARIALLIVQGVLSLGAFVCFPGIIFFIRNSDVFETSAIKLSWQMWAIVAGLAVLMMPVNAWLSVWNESIHFPSFLKQWEQIAIDKEEELKKVTFFLVDFQNVYEMLLGFLVIAILAGLTEEFFFRKLIQPRVIALFGNFHIGIWITAFIFSAIHMQFYGLIPRMVLGALFGYYYFWTGRIAVPILAHACNNFITLIGLYLYTQNLSPIDIENPQTIPWFVGAVSAGVAWSLALMLWDETEKVRSKNLPFSTASASETE
jgi:membrane protease YdiL (CAAX protease family)